MDDIAKRLSQRWKVLTDHNAVWTRPLLDLTEETARQRVDPFGWFGELSGRNVLCLASGGGQQSAAFGVLGANVTVFDLSSGQLERDRTAAAHYGYQVVTVEGDMRDLSRFGASQFDIVYQPYSINFVPSPLPVYEGVRRVLRPGGHYRFKVVNPFVAGMTHRDWRQDGYSLRRPYLDGEEVSYPDQEWVFKGDVKAPPPREFRHALGAIVRGLATHGFVLDDLREDTGADPDAEPGSWGHFQAVVAPWWSVHTRVAAAADNS